MSKKLKAYEYNFDGLIGPTHNYAGLSFGNKASIKNKQKVSNPQKAALEGLAKMQFLMDKGFKQGVLPPHARPDLPFLRQLGFSGKGEKVIQQAYKFSPSLLTICYSASAMWTANWATLSPQYDTKDGKTHITPANLISFPHRALEAKQTTKILKKIFFDSQYFTHHPPYAPVPVFADEGAANHSRLCSAYHHKGLELFVYGKKGFNSASSTQKFPPRQGFEASALNAFRHVLDPSKVVMVQQNPLAIDAGVFHNDVISVGDHNLLFYHEESFVNTPAVIKEIKQKLLPTPLIEVKVLSKELSLKNAVSSYLFNSQLLPMGTEEGTGTEDKGPTKWMLIAPLECEQNLRVKNYISYLTAHTVIKKVHFVPIRQSMQNGGGPACLRLRVVLPASTEPNSPPPGVHPGVLLTPQLVEQLRAWVLKHYRDRLSEKDLLDPLLIQESQSGLDKLTELLNLGSIYPFQQDGG